MYVEAIKWLDSGLSLDEGWATAEEYVAKAGLARMEAMTVGFVFHEDDDQVLVALSHDPEHGTYFSAQVIWKKAIISRTILTAVHGDQLGFGGERAA